ncbi:MULTISPECIES: Fic family protein [unclassified Streptomyces]|uniref:Fic family protein n=1 Tax=unclassified Streptomyces TaxID=2593676 RepID=UPI00226EB78E|nr:MULTISPECIES: Fic family protein [unclassified Streptomyces]MCY0924131.1 Fic family protein [Streptomyces sp. H27-G5]MCY0963163.1 Fic family protein [Streptomyces sp. H27-H5]
MLYETPELDDEDRRVLDEIEEMRERLRHQLRAQPRWQGQLRRNLTARAIAGSNTIEGYAATVDDVEALMSGEEPLETEERTRVELEGYQRAMTYIQALSDAGPGFRYDAGLLNGLHFMLQGHHLDKRPGRWRDGPVFVTSPDDPLVPAYTAPDEAQVPGLTGELIDWLNEGDLDASVHVRASMAHLNLVNIHPWKDGNGRMSRSVSTLVFAREALMPPEFSSIEEWLGYGRNTYGYYNVLQRVGGPSWNPKRDTHPWIRFCLGAHHRQAQVAQRRTDLLARAWIRLGEEAATEALDERVVYALLPAFWGSRVLRTVYQHDAELSDQQAIRDLRELVRRGWLVAHGQTRARTYGAGLRIEQVQQDVRQSLDPYIDPYERR